MGRVRLAIESTTKVVEVDGVAARVWEGTTETGIPVLCFVTRVGVDRSEDQAQFEAELESHRAPRSRDLDAWPSRLVL